MAATVFMHNMTAFLVSFILYICCTFKRYHTLTLLMGTLRSRLLLECVLVLQALRYTSHSMFLQWHVENTVSSELVRYLSCTVHLYIMFLKTSLSLSQNMHFEDTFLSMEIHKHEYILSQLKSSLVLLSPRLQKVYFISLLVITVNNC